MPSMKIKLRLQTEVAEGLSALPVGQWKMIYASFVYNDGVLAAALVSKDLPAADSASFTLSSYGTSAFSSSDKITIGAGFIGQLRRVQIYSPAAFEPDTSL